MDDRHGGTLLDAGDLPGDAGSKRLMPCRAAPERRGAGGT